MEWLERNSPHTAPDAPEVSQYTSSASVSLRSKEAADTLFAKLSAGGFLTAPMWDMF
ncbi:MAG: hypothetical protein OXH85_13640 [Truepera sp.]|nr:hypothetical protein [Truepera sp.]